MRVLKRILVVFGLLLAVGCNNDSSHDFESPGIWHFAFSSTNNGYSGECDVAIMSDGEYKTFINLTDQNGQSFSASLDGHIENGHEVYGDLIRNNYSLGYLDGEIYKNDGSGFVYSDATHSSSQWSAYRVSPSE